MVKTFPTIRKAFSEAGYSNDDADRAIDAFHEAKPRVPMLRWCMDYAKEFLIREIRYDAPPPNAPIDTDTELRPVYPAVKTDHQFMREAEARGRESAKTAAEIELEDFKRRTDERIAKFKAAPEKYGVFGWRPDIHAFYGEIANRPNITPL